MKKVIVFLLSAYSGFSIACSCVSYKPHSKEDIKASYDNAASVVIATAVSIENLDSEPALIVDENGNSSPLNPHPTQKTRFTVLESFKGEHASDLITEIDLRCCLCGISFQEGETYLLYLYRTKDKSYYATSICSRTRTLASLDSLEINYLQELSSNEIQRAD